MVLRYVNIGIIGNDGIVGVVVRIPIAAVPDDAVMERGVVHIAAVVVIDSTIDELGIFRIIIPPMDYIKTTSDEGGIDEIVESEFAFKDNAFNGQVMGRILDVDTESSWDNGGEGVLFFVIHTTRAAQGDGLFDIGGVEGAARQGDDVTTGSSGICIFESVLAIEDCNVAVVFQGGHLGLQLCENHGRNTQERHE